MTRNELRDYVDEQRTLDNIPYHVYSALIDGIDTLEQEPNISLEVYKQVAKERDIAIEQLHELGYEFGQKIEPTTKKDCNTCTHSNETDGSNCYECVKDMCNNYEPTTKNNLGVDCIDRTELLKAMDTWDKFGYTTRYGLERLDKDDKGFVPYVHYEDMVNCVKNMSSVTPQPCEDSVSRKAINGYIDYILSHGMGKKKSFDFIKKFVANLPTVTPQEPKTENDVLISRKKVMQILQGFRRSGLVTPRIIAEMEHDIKLIK